MSEKVLSVFIDESGDFGAYASHAPFYLVSMILHDQSFDITSAVKSLEENLQHLGYQDHAIHTGPLIRRESVYANDLMENRKHLFNVLFHFTRLLNINYLTAKIKKKECSDIIELTAKLSVAIADMLRKNEMYFNSFERVVIYYDNGQVELTKVLTSVFSALYSYVDYRKVQPVDYKLFQVADLICTIELLAEKAETNSLSKSEKEFFGSPRDFKKNYLKAIRKKVL